MEYTFREYQKEKILRDHLNLGGENPAGERIEVNSLYLERGGRPWIGVMGEFHYVRFERSGWYRELCKMKAGGIDVLSTYLFWIYHEETEGEFDFTGRRDLRAFVQEAARAGLDVVIRIGPWAHGECRNGGLPDWLLSKPWPVRQDNPGYLQKVRLWYEQIYEQVKGMLYHEGGNIIGIQLENELVDDAGHLLTLKRIAQEVGLLAPVYTVTGWNSKYGAKIPVDEVMPVFGGYPEAPWAQSTDRLPLNPHYVFCKARNDSAIGVDVIKDTDADGWRMPYERYPFATCELGGGMHPTHHRRPIVSGMDVYTISLVRLGDGNNLIGYYLYHGGSNLIGKHSTLQESRATGYPNDYSIISYDFQAPLSEYGEAREHYGMLNLLNLFAQDFGEVLAPMEPVESAYLPVPEDMDSLRYAMRTDGRSGFVFVNHYQRLAKLRPVKDAEIVACGVRFPRITVEGDICFFFPFRMDLGGEELEYATAQPVCRAGNVFFFAEIPGIAPEYRFADGNLVSVRPEKLVSARPEKLASGVKDGTACAGGADRMSGTGGADEASGTEPQSGFMKGNVRIVTLSWEDACRFRRLDGMLAVGDSCDVYAQDGEICAIEDGSFAYWEWNGAGFDRHTVEKETEDVRLSAEELAEAPFDPPYGEQLRLGGERKLTWKKLTVTGGQGFVEIADACDVEQIYADGRLVADRYYYGCPWRVPAKLLYGKECYLVYSEMKDDFYREF